MRQARGNDPAPSASREPEGPATKAELDLKEFDTRGSLGDKLRLRAIPTTTSDYCCYCYCYCYCCYYYCYYCYYSYYYSGYYYYY